VNAPRNLPIDADEAAAAWFAHARSGAMTASDREALRLWLDADCEHRRAYEECKAVWGALRSIRDEPPVLALREQVRRRSRRRWLGVGAAAVAASILVAWGAPVLWRQVEVSRGIETAGMEQPTRFGAGVGQVSRILLQDGSTVVLDADSAISVRFGPHARALTLDKGRAFFHVAHEARPFTVAANRFSVRATGTQFVVDRIGDSETVSMIEGSVIATPARRDAGLRPVSLTAGSGLRDDGQGRWVVTKISIPAERGWMSGLLTFRQEPVGRIAEEMNRYSQRKIVIDDPELAQSRLSAVLRAGDSDTLISALSDLGMAKVASRDASEIVLTRP
jgi:transmembrane sensor